ncbi:MAG: efflux RND transporter periplasmic adaptor subunit [Parachlamydiaceae bacterium]
MKKRSITLLMTGFMGAACTLLTYALWTTAMSPSDDQHDDHEHDHDHHDEFLHFSHELAATHGIILEKVSPGTLQQRARAPARITIVSDQIAHVLPKVGGTVVKAYKNLGETVDKNEVLALVDSTEMAEAKSAYASGLKKLQLAETVYARESALYGKKLSAAEDFHEAENTKDQAIIDLELSRQKLRALGMTYKKIDALATEDPKSMKMYELKSPLTGQVISRNITPGEMVTTDKEMYVIADLSIVWAEINVSAHDRQFVKVGQPVTITDNHGNSVIAQVSFLSPIVDLDTRTSKAIASITNEHETWLPGTFVQAEFITDFVNTPVTISKDAIQNLDGVDVVFVSEGDGFAVRPVTVGRSDETCCEVVSGLKPGETYASKNTFLLKADLKKEEAEHMD